MPRCRTHHFPGSLRRMKLESHAATDRGQVRTNNEDTYLVLAQQRVFAVADGMGGHAAGEVASRLAIDSVAQLRVSAESTPDDLQELLTGGGMPRTRAWARRSLRSV